MKLVVLLVVVGACLMVPATALADSGSITNVVDRGDGSAQATYTTTSTTCTAEGFCGWFPVASQVPASQACGASYGSDLTYVGEFQETSGSQSASEIFFPMASSVRLCLYISGPDLIEHLVAQYLYASSPPPPPTPAPPPPPIPTPAPIPTPTPAPTPRSHKPYHAPTLRMAAAQRRVPAALRAEYRSWFRHHRRFGGSCSRLGSHKIRCRVHWTKGHFRYRARVMLRNDLDEPASITWEVLAHRKRIHHKPEHAAPKPPAPRPTPKPPAPRPSCDANYGGCLKPNVSDYDCSGGSGDGPYYTGPVRVIGDDHYDLDRDGDGIGCDD